MKKTIQLITVAVLSGAAFYSCKKKEEPAPATTTTSGTTTSGTTTSGTTTSGTTTSGTTTSGTTTSGTTSGTTTSAPNPKTEFLIDKNWGMTAATVEPAFIVFGTPIADLFEPNLATFPQVIAIKDDTIRFSALNKAALNGAYTWKVYTKFGSEQDQQGAWKFNSNQSQIIFTSTSGTETIFDIVSLESNKMTVKSKMANPIDPADRTEYKVTSTFKAK